MDSFGPTSHSYYSQRLRMHYVDWGNTEAPPLILVHGARDHCRNWDWVARELRKDWHVIALDLRGHGDSAWSPDGYYSYDAYLCDLDQLIQQKNLGPATIIAHSMGGTVAVRYAATFPEKVKKMVLIEGVGLEPEYNDAEYNKPFTQKMREWIEYRHGLAARTPKRYPCIEDAIQRMHDENKHLSAEQARHLTIHGASQNEDGTYSWKFDNYCRRMAPMDIGEAQLCELITEIQCPTFLAWGTETFVSDPVKDGRFEYFNNAKIEYYKDAGHWLHHDQLDNFLSDVRAFI
ncbi:MAG: pimeloyl-ACP methyl ester carboxylesterase [Zhongshania sp.]|jgi:pimeloyl-ACP methyl ester carboxylesterase